MINKNENDIMKLDNRQIGSNLAISTSQFVKNISFMSDRVYLSPTALGSLKSGNTITLSAYLSNISIDSLALEIIFNDANDAQVGFFTGDFVSTNGLYTFTTTIPANAVGGDIYAVQPYSSAVSNAFGIQDLKLELGSVVTPWKPSIYALANLQRDLGSLTTDFDTHTAESAAKHITESGSNARGRYVKYDDGTLTMTGFATLTLEGVGSASLSATYTFPINCIDTSYGISVQALTLLGGTKRNAAVVVVRRSVSNVKINYSVSANNILKSGDTVDVSVTINGTWK